MDMSAINLLLICDDTFQSFVPPNLHVWVDNLNDEIVTNTGQKIVFNAPYLG